MPTKFTVAIILFLFISAVFLGFLFFKEKRLAEEQLVLTENALRSKQNFSKSLSYKNEWLTYKNDKHGVSINLPPLYGASLSAGGLFALSQVLEDSRENNKLELYDWTDCTAGTIFSMEVQENFLDSACKNAALQKDCEVEAITVNGLPGKSFSCTKKEKNGDFYQYARREGACFSRGDKTYTLELATEPEEVSEEMFELFSSSSDLFKEVVKSFTLE